MKTRKKQGIVIERIVSMLLIFSIVLGFPAWEVRAEEKTDITVDSYSTDEAGEYIYVANIADATYGSITVPAGYHFIIEQAISADSITLEAGAFLEIVDGPNKAGRLNCSTIQASEGAEMIVSVKANLPSNVVVTPLQSNSKIDEDGEFWNLHLKYENSQWVEQVDIPEFPQLGEDEFILRLEELDEDMVLKVEYSFDESYWQSALPHKDDEEAPSSLTLITSMFETGTHNLDVPFTVPEGNGDKNTIYFRINLEYQGTYVGPKKIIHGYDILGGEDGLGYIDIKTQHTLSLSIKFENFRSNSYHNLVAFLGYDNAGDPRIVDEAKKYLYAYSRSVDVSTVSSEDTIKAIKERLAYELYMRFINVPMFESFGLPTNVRDEELQAAIDELSNRISIVYNAPESVNVETGQRIVYKYTATINWGVDMEDGTPLQSILPVYYGLPQNNILIAPEFNSATGACSGNLYMRDLANRNAMKKLGQCSASAIPTDERIGAPAITIALSEFSNVVRGGDFIVGNVISTGDTTGAYIAECRSNEDFYHKFINANTQEHPVEQTIRVIDSDYKYVLLDALTTGTSSQNINTDPLGVNGTRTDVLWETGQGCRAQVYIGCNEIGLYPLNYEIGLSHTNITNVTLADSTMADGVVISVREGIYTVKFLSNYYDEVTLNITYEDNVVAPLTIERIGLSIQYHYLDHESDQKEIQTECNGGTYEYSYDYSQGEQIAVWAVYYHPANYTTASGADNLTLRLLKTDGSVEYITQCDYNPPANGGVATSIFFLGFAPGEDENENSIYTQVFSKGPFYATVLNAGYDNDQSFSGIQVGSDRGIYWDGVISWQFGGH